MKTYVVSSFIPNANIDNNFVYALQAYCRLNKAELIISECKFNYKRDIENNIYNDSIREEFASVLKKSYKFNDNLFLSDFKQSINVVDPLSGMDSFAVKKGSFLLPFPRHRFKTVSRMLKDGHTPLAMWCTGTVSKPYYKDSKSGIRMSPYHVIGALVVHVENDKIYHVRQLQWDGQGFYDLLYYYDMYGATKVNDAVEVLNMGDDHAIFQHPEAMKCTIEMIEKLNPKHVFRHDTLDCASISHHVEGKYITKASINLTLEEELVQTGATINEFRLRFPNIIQHMVPSNHNEHLDRYLDECRYRDDKFNHIIGLELALAKAKGHNVFEYAMSKYYNLSNVIFYNRSDSLKINGTEMLCHGDEGSNGARGSVTEAGLVYDGNVITGHTHSPEIGVYGNYCNGTLTKLSLPYTKDSGGSKWMHTNTIQYKNGKKTHLHIIPKR